jgi:hypothetical protein
MNQNSQEFQKKIQRSYSDPEIKQYHQKSEQPFFFVYNTNTHSWCFIARTYDYTSNMYALEKWTVGNKKYIINRICYKQEQAAEFIRLAAYDNLPRMIGPDIYCIIDEDTQETIITVWKPHINEIEIQYNQTHELLPETSSFDDIKSVIVCHLESQNNFEKIKIESLTPNDHNHVIKI